MVPTRRRLEPAARGTPSLKQAQKSDTATRENAAINTRWQQFPAYGRGQGSTTYNMESIANLSNQD